MNETEKAIEHFHYGVTHDIFSEPVTTYARLAVDALHEKAERSRGCVSCDGGFGDNAAEFEKLGYTMCPHCGKRLEVEP